MKSKLFILAITFFVQSLCAQQKGINQLPTANRQLRTSSYAVVVGISDYQDPAIPDLRFADKDAEAFANYLRSNAGGKLDNDHLKVLLNKDATAAQFAIALDWLMEVVKENDQVILYFSGHGDVEKKTITQPGYLLCWDAPSRVYLAGGAIALPMFQDVISTLSSQNKARVIVITDACRSGKLAGSSVGGSQITGANLAKQYANEIKILSCQPNEYSIEGEQWGGGRGVFSYHLIDALYGLADNNNDQWVTLQEIGRYLEDHVSNEVSPLSQVPMIIGNRNERMTNVDEVLLASIKSGKTNQIALMTSIESRGMEDDVLSRLDTSTRKIYGLFKKALKDKVFLEPANACAETYYQQLIKEPKLERLHSTMKRNYAAALQDDAQQVMNKWLTMDNSEYILSKKTAIDKYKNYPRYLQRATELLGKTHYMYPVLNSRIHFFEGYMIAYANRNPSRELGERALAQFRQALQWQKDLPQAYWQLSMVYGFNLLQKDSAEWYAKFAVDLQPGWIMPYNSLAFLLTDKYKDFDRAKFYLNLASQIDSNSVLFCNTKGVYFFRQNKYAEAEREFKKAIRIDSTLIHAYNNLGLVYESVHRYDEAVLQFLKVIELDSTFVYSYCNLGVIYQNTHRMEEAEALYKKAIRLDSTHIGSYLNLGGLYYLIKRFSDAEPLFKKAEQLDSTDVNVHNNLGNVFASTGRYSEAERQFKIAIQLDSTNATYAYYLGNIYSMIQRPVEAEQYFQKAIQLDSTKAEVFFGQGLNYATLQNNEKAEQSIQKAIRLDSTKTDFFFTLGSIYLSGKQYQNAERLFKKAIQLDSNNVGALNNLGNVYMENQQYAEAERNIVKAIRLDPNNVDYYYNLACCQSMLNRLGEAFESLESSLSKGFNDYEDMLKDETLSPLRAQIERWKTLMKKYFPEKEKK